MDLALGAGGDMMDRVRLTLTRRDLMLMSLCLEVMAREHAKGGSLRSDIESLQIRLAQRQPEPEASRRRLAG